MPVRRSGVPGGLWGQACIRLTCIDLAAWPGGACLGMMRGAIIILPERQVSTDFVQSVEGVCVTWVSVRVGKTGE